MALHSVTTPTTYARREPDPYERLHTKLAGLQAITSLAIVAHEQGDVTDQVWLPLWGFLGELSDELQLDADELRGERLQRLRQEVSNG